MARPTRNNAEYFYHSANFRNDRRVRAIRARFGAAGYGLLLMLMEALTDSEFTKIATDETELELLAGDFGVSVAEIDSLLQICEKVGLFCRDNDGNLVSLELNESLKSVFEKRNRSREAFEKAKKDVSVTETPISATESTRSKKNRSKEKESKEETNSSSDGAEVPPSSDEYTITHKLRLVMQELNPNYFWDGREGKAAKQLAEKLRYSYKNTLLKEPTDEQIVDSFKRLIAESRKLPDRFYHFSDMPKFNEHYNKLVELIRNPAPAGGQSSNGATSTKRPKALTSAVR